MAVATIMEKQRACQHGENHAKPVLAKEPPHPAGHPVESYGKKTVIRS
jgi:hypothetical protein